MKIRVKLFGTLSRYVSGFRPGWGMDLDLPDGARVSELMHSLGIQKSQGDVVATGGRILKADDELKEGMQVDIFQLVFGG